MTRDGFLSRLREGLKGLPPGAADDVILTIRPAHLEQHVAGSGRIVQNDAPAALKSAA